MMGTAAGPIYVPNDVILDPPEVPAGTNNPAYATVILDHVPSSPQDVTINFLRASGTDFVINNVTPSEHVRIPAGQQAYTFPVLPERLQQPGQLLIKATLNGKSTADILEVVRPA